MHNVRVRVLQYAAPIFAGALENFPRGAQPEKEELTETLKLSEDSIAAFLAECEASGKVKNWNGPPESMLGYLVAHEAHHRGLVMVAIRISGHKLSKEVVYGQWDWGKKRSNR